MQTPNSKTLTITFWAVLFFALLGTTAYAALNDTFIPQREPYSELYISQGPTLRNGVVIFSFTVRNVEGHTMSYPYLIYAQAQNGQSQILKYDTVTVENGQQAEVDTHFGVPYSPAVILVDLPQTRQQIHFAIPFR